MGFTLVVLQGIRVGAYNVKKQLEALSLGPLGACLMHKWDQSDFDLARTELG